MKALDAFLEKLSRALGKKPITDLVLLVHS